jgi:hypothetical protein
MMTIKPIETKYQGYRFRSRLEARWAVFFDMLSIKWEYEKEGFNLDGVYYLPDFWLPDQRCWIEIKAEIEGMTAEETTKVLRFHEALYRHPDQSENWRDYYIFAGRPYFNGERHAYTVYGVREPYQSKALSLECLNDFWWTHCPLCGRFNLASYYPQYGRYDDERTEGLQCMHCDCVDRNWVQTDKTWFAKGIVETRLKGFILGSDKLMTAYSVAASARFERDADYLGNDPCPNCGSRNIRDKGSFDKCMDCGERICGDFDS